MTLVVVGVVPVVSIKMSVLVDLPKFHSFRKPNELDLILIHLRRGRPFQQDKRSHG